MDSLQQTTTKLSEKIKSSEILNSIRQANELFSFRKAIKVPSTIVSQLIANGNRADQWDNVKCFPGTQIDASRIVNCRFEGIVVLGGYFLKDGVQVEGETLRCGLYGSTIKNCIIGNDCLVTNTNLLANVVLSDRAVVYGCGTVTCSGHTSFANGIQISVGVEIGGRDIPCYAEMTFDDAVAVGTSQDQKQALKNYANLVDQYSQVATSRATILCENAQIINCSRIRDVYIGSYGTIKGGDVENVTLLSQQDERTSVTGGCFIRNSILQWGSHTDSLGIIQKSLLCDHSHVDRHGKLLDSILGPNSGVSEGECSSSLVGPFVGFHHQALLIACVWPSGKGNIGYGANVGSNHTLKAPDQELWPGEGVFFGLGVCIKYPCNLVNSPYSVIATGVSTLPQVLEMPFSLINIPGQSIAGLSPAFNEIFPGWVLWQCIFTVLRNEEKFAKRNKSRRSTIESEVLRPTIIGMMIESRSRLSKAANPRLFGSNGEGIYTEKEIKGIGKNYMTQSSLDQGIQAYTFYIQYYALRGLYRQLEQGGSTNTILSPSNISCSRWRHELSIILSEFPGENVPSLLEKFVKFQKAMAKSAEVGKARDDKRGVTIIPDYNMVHKQASEEPVIISAKKFAENIEASISKILSKL